MTLFYEFLSLLRPNQRPDHENSEREPELKVTLTHFYIYIYFCLKSIYKCLLIYLINNNQQSKRLAKFDNRSPFKTEETKIFQSYVTKQ